MSGVALNIGSLSRYGGRINSLSRTIIAAAVQSAWSPLSLFAAGEQGAWYDPSDLTSMFQDSAGTTPVTAVEQPVGLILDKRLGLALGAEIVGNTDFASDTWWVKGSGVAISGGRANLTAASGYALYRTSLAEIVAGGYYEVTYTVSGYAGGSIRPYVGATPVFGPTVSANGTHATRICASSGGELGLNCPSAFTGSIDDVSVKRVAGNHATQTTSASRPTLKQDGSGLYYLSFDGADDSLSTSSINFSSSDEMTVLAGVRKNSDAAQGMLLELSANLSLNSGTFWLLAPLNTASGDFDFSFKGTNQIQVNSGSKAAPALAVLTAIDDISSDSAVMRYNGAQVSTSSGDQGSGSFGNHALYIGRRGGASLPFNGRLYGLIVRGAATSGADLSSAESWMAARTGVTL